MIDAPELPAIDYELGLTLVGNKSHVAKELLEKFIGHLSDSHTNINKAFKKNDFEELHFQVHRLHSACCYCGVPRLKAIVDEIETQLKENEHSHLSKLIPTLNTAIDDIFKAYKTNEYKD